MAIIDTEDLQSWPLFSRNPWLLRLRLNHIQDDRDYVLVRLADRADICVGSKGFDCAEGFLRDFARLEEWEVRGRLLLLRNNFGDVRFDQGRIVSVLVKLSIVDFVRLAFLLLLRRNDCSHYELESGSLYLEVTLRRLCK